MPKLIEKRVTKRARFQAAIAAQGWPSVSREEWEYLRTELPDISEQSLRDWLHDSGLPVQQPYRGVRTKSLEELEDSLVAMTELYERDPPARRACREVVIAAKDRARFASRNANAEEGKRRLKEEMVEWMLVWLDDPAMFPAWASLRRGNFAGNGGIR